MVTVIKSQLIFVMKFFCEIERFFLEIRDLKIYFQRTQKASIIWKFCNGIKHRQALTDFNINVVTFSMVSEGSEVHFLLSFDHRNIEINNTDKPSLCICLFTGDN